VVEVAVTEVVVLATSAVDPEPQLASIIVNAENAKQTATVGGLGSFLMADRSK